MNEIIAALNQSVYETAIARLEYEAAAAARLNPPPDSALVTDREVWLKAKAMDVAFALTADQINKLLPARWAGAGPDPEPTPEIAG